MKTCNKCHQPKPLDSFSLAKTNKYGICHTCKDCKNEYTKNYTAINKVSVLASRKEHYNRTKNIERTEYIYLTEKKCPKCNMVKPMTDFSKSKKNITGYKYVCKICINTAAKNAYLTSGKITQQKYYEQNKEKLNTFKVNKRKTNIQYRLQCNLRTRFCEAVKNNYKTGSAVNDLGCTISFFKSYIESQFTEGMSWDNWSRTGWHLDHKKPLSSFDLTNRSELLKATHYTNIQPMWASDNLKKGDSILSVHA